MEDINGINEEDIDVEGDEEDEVDPSTLDLTSIVNITFPPNNDTLFAILKAHNDRAKELNKIAEARKAGVKVNDLDTEVRNKAKAIADKYDSSKVEDTLNTLIYDEDETPTLDTLVAYLSVIESVRSDLRDTIDHFVTKEVKRIKSERNIQETGDESFARERATCKALFSMLQLQTEMVKMLNGGEKWEAPEGLYRADTERTLYNVVTPPKDKSNKDRGSTATERKCQYTLDGTDLPLGISLNELCFEYLSKGSNRITRKKLDTLMKEAGIKSVSNENRPWNVTLPNGSVLLGHLVKTS